ncbi:Glycerol-3-phosphate acyltransferase [Gemmatirosa kalamazoonensis]|uniref:Glycerol-3-phosphate acyltransferase n=1 Tax=Gemmatirosa kalamazoonensis TaxID=861299 RepID=W0RMX2_9BACT|nr:glycerol-3-phosphate 1-O-acyltransferase PlsY [Gemmatirosa kalamazoonensis]AHG90773.1 Glycerol-3-phosphate acyltransferase [Gemmatirosa kalamazoonensis]
MTDAALLAAGLAASYAAGSIPTAYLAGKAKGVDLRKHGSGNLGATNAWRVLGWRVGLAVYAVDTLKGFLPVFLLPRPVAHAELAAIAYGVAAIVGHVRPVFLGFQKGGKGVATAGGVFLALAPLPFVIALGVFLGVFLATGYVSAGSLSAAVALPFALFVYVGRPSPTVILALLVALFVFWTHRANIGRLRRGEESRFRIGRRATSEGTPR